jgi:hypothetical protein
MAALSLIVYLITYFATLVNLARLQHWEWFVFMVLFNWITLLVYVIAGPTTPVGY